MKLSKSRLRTIIKEELARLVSEGLDSGEREKLASLEKEEEELAAERSKNDSNAAKEKHDKLKDKIKSLKNKEHN